MKLRRTFMFEQRIDISNFYVIPFLYNAFV